MDSLFCCYKRLAKQRFLLLVLLTFGSVILAACSEPVTPTATPIHLKQYENGNAFDILYPAEWSVDVMRQGVILFGSETAIDLNSTNIEPTLLVYRQEPNPNLTL